MMGVSTTTQSGCGRSSKEVTVSSPATEVRSPEYLLKRLSERDQQANKIKSMTARLRITNEGPGGNISASGQLVWIRDSVLCVAVKKFGYEAIRALVTPDSVFVMNRLDKTYTAESIVSLQSQFNLPMPAKPSELVTRVLLGQIIRPDNTPLKSSIVAERHQLQGIGSQVVSTYTIEEGTFWLAEQGFISVADKASAVIESGRFQKIVTQPYPFPYFRRVTMLENGQPNGQVEIEFSDVDINNNPTYKFEIPQNYTRKTNE
jgi:Domain of unknown function (DUF4292)